MWSNSVSIDIHAPPETIFAYLADFTRHAEWSNVVRIKLVSGEPGRVGSEYEAFENIPAEITTFARISELDPPRRIGWEATDKRVFRTTWRFEIEPVGKASRLTQSVTFYPLTMFANLILYIFRVPFVQKENLQSLERVKSRLEI